MRNNQSFTRGLGPAGRFEVRWKDEAQAQIRAAFLGMAKHLRGRPASCKSPFNEAGGARQTPGWSLITAARACLDAAQEKGEPTLDATRREVVAYCEELKAAMLHGYEPSTVSAETAIVECAREESEAHTALTRWAVTRAPHDALAAKRELREAQDAAARVLTLGSRLALPSHALPMGACR